MSATKRGGTRRYVMPVMVEVNCDDDEVTRVVTLPEELRIDRDDRGEFLMYDKKFVRRHGDEQPQTHALFVARPQWESERFPVGTPVNWAPSLEWEEGFDLTEADDVYSRVHPYAEPRR